jgi:DNA relaxase NicK
MDYFRITVHTTLENCEKLYKECFEYALGSLTDQEHGAKGFKCVLGALLGFQLKFNPGNDRNYCTFEFPGQVCGSIAPEQLIDFYNLTRIRKYKTNVTRLDFAFDNVPFSPFQIYQAILNDASRKENEKPIVRTLTHRETVNWVSTPLKKKEDGSGIGQDTCYFGERSSMRFLRVYNKRGPTRLELELKDRRADLVASLILEKMADEWPDIAISNLRDFIDIDLPWWYEFISNRDRAYNTLKYAKDVYLEKKEQWLLNQVSPTLAAVSEVTSGEILLKMHTIGRKRMDKKYHSLITAHKFLLPKTRNFNE